LSKPHIYQLTDEDYEKLSNLDQADTLLYSTTGNGLTMMSNRLSWFYDLRGGSMTIDTACSSSLVALHQACLDLRTSTRSCRQAIIGGVNLVLSPDMMAVLNPLHFLSPDSKCYSFDERANGYARGDGVGILILKHIDDAIRDNDCIRAVIRGTGINQDGKTPGIALPSAEAQMRLIKATYEAFNIPLDETSYFEAHGTGTPAGDSMEISAIASVFDRTGPDAHPLFIGTCKPNIGHVEGAAGVAGLIKTILSLERGIIPPNINFVNPNPKLRLEERNFKVPTEPTPWPNPGTRRASVNSFGYGGTNAHCILEDAYHYLSPRGLGGRTRTIEAITMAAPDPDGYDSGVSFGDEMDTLMGEDSKKKKIVVLSTPDQAALPRLAKSHSDYLKTLADSQDELTEDILDNLAFTYNCRRSYFQWRTAFVASSISELAEQLSDVSTPTRAGKPPGIFFCFTGQGAQWHAMGRELMIYDVYRESIESAESYLSSIGATWSVVTELFREEKDTNINQQKYSQPLCAIVQMALVDLLRHWDIHPKVVVGHSSGEIAAAYTVGALTAEDSWKLAYHRGRLCSDLKYIAPHLQGTMLAVGLSSKEVEPYIEKLGLGENDVLSVACYNSPTSITMTGDVHAVKKLEAELKSAGVFARLLKVDNAYHSEHIRNIQEPLRESIKDIKARQGDPDILLFSSATGEQVQPIDLDVDYWVMHTVTPVRFDAAVTSAVQAGKPGRRKGAKAAFVNTIIELGPHCALQGPIRQILDNLKKKESVSYVSALIRGKSAVDTSLSMAGSIWCRGFDVALQRVNSPSKIPGARIPVTDLPKYPWNHEHKYWHEGIVSRSTRFRVSPRTDILGEPVQEFSRKDPVWKNFVRISEVPWLMDHKIKDNIIFPATGMICAALEAAEFLADKSKTVKGYELRDIKVGRALMIPISDPGIEVFTKLRPQRKFSNEDICQTYDFVFISLEISVDHNVDQIEHASGTVTIMYHDSDDSNGPEEQFKRGITEQAYQNALTECADEVSAESHYDLAMQKGIEYGPTFQGLKSAMNCVGKSTFVLEIQDTKSFMPANYEFPLLVHPTTLDAALQTALQALEAQDRTDTLVPSGFDSIYISTEFPNKPETKLIGFATANWTGFNDASANIKLSIEGWPSTMIAIGNMTLTSLGDGSGETDNVDQEEALRKLAAKQLWKPAIDLIDPKRHNMQSIFGRDLETPEEITICSSAATKVTAIYIKRALMFMTPELEVQLPSHAIKMLNWMRERNRLAQEGKLDYQEESGEDWLNLPFAEEERLIQDGIDRYPEYGLILQKIGRNLPHILAGTLTPLQYMLENDMLSKLFTKGTVLKSGLRMFAQWFDLQGHKHPDMKILEVGGGTGSITLPVLKALSSDSGSVPRFTSYCFTDITPGWFEKAVEKFQEWKTWMEFKKLDIEKDLDEQGFLPESFDVIAASNVLHATTRLQTTLSNCLKLLKPGGKIVIGEMTYKSDHDSLVFGVLPGWWLSEDGREDSPLITQEQWKKELLDAGFASVDDPVAAHDVQGRPLLSMIVGHKPVIESDKPLSKVVIVKPIIHSSLGDKLVEILQERYASSGIAVTAVNLEEASQLTESVDPHRVVLSLLEAFDPVLARCSEEQFEAIRTVILSTDKLVWVSCLVTSNGVRKPDACAISGLLRSVKSEIPSLSFNELHLRKRDISELPEAADIILSIVHKLKQAENASDIENEIVEVDGMLQIPRIFDDFPMNKVLRSLGRVADPEPQLLLQEGRPLKMTIGKPGVLGSLYFVDDAVLEDSLPEGEVEIEVKANSINLK
jgi:acyl transferase domain-containing protein/ubiquinone/menaquinone biosynthesis C-methylase UbiE